MANETLFESVGRLFFSRERVKSLEKELNIAGVNIPADSFAGYMSLNVIIVSLFLTALLLVYPPAVDGISGFAKQYIELPLPLIGIFVLVIALIVVYLATTTLVSSYLLMKADDRRAKLENTLPDFLSLVASNIKAGMTLDQAMWYSAKPEFGLLSIEVKARIKSSFSGQSLEDTLDQLGGRFDSKVFKRTILLLKQATATGGELTNVLERTADDVRNSIIMKKEIAATLVLYEIFVLFASVVGTPFLFAVASKLIEVFERISPAAGSAGNIPSSGGVFTTFSNIKFAGPIISSADFFWFSIPTIFVTALISSFIVSVIRTGSKSQGMKYFPFVLLTSYLVYWLVTSAVDSLFATIT
ncbi:MAG TPA: type II secretion system F family protein [Candidatus Bilamarchaeum sp.]|nr:type II secretion system F family protein [Candidatus Bilamarchaeum sp.]